MELIGSNGKGIWRQKLVPWLGLACILVAFVVAVIRLHPTNLFGYTEDDSIYFSSAKAIAEGDGYVLASFPGTPAATKYPIFYPWLLSWVWRWNPSFPANLPDAIAINVAFGGLYLTVTFFFLRGFKDIGEIEALLLTAFCALHPLVVFYSGSLLSEAPFAALTLAAMLLAEKAMRPDGRLVACIGCGVLLGSCLLTRAFALPVVAGIVLIALFHRARRQLIALSAALIPFFTLFCWRTIFTHPPLSPASGPAASGIGWTHTWTYYTSYLNVWKEGVPTVAIFFAMLKNNALLLLSTPASYFISPNLGVGVIAARTIIVTLTVVIFAGIGREAFRRGVRPVHLVLPIYMLLVLIWNYGQAERFLIPFLPVFAVGIWLEARHLLKMVRDSIFGPRTVVERSFAIAFGFILLALFLSVARNYLGGVRAISGDLSRRRGALLEEKREAYEWLSHSTDPSARIVAYEDASLYLYSGRTASRPFTFTTAEFYDPKLLESDIDHMTDVPRAIGAEYWVSSDDDYDFEWSDAYQKGHAQMRKLAQTIPVVYRSRYNHVQIYFLGSLGHNEPSLLGKNPGEGAISSSLTEPDLPSVTKKRGHRPMDVSER
jgi:hypothetical protein